MNSFFFFYYLCKKKYFLSVLRKNWSHLVDLSGQYNGLWYFILLILTLHVFINFLIFRSNTASLVPSTFLKVHASEPYETTGLIAVMYNCISNFIGKIFKPNILLYVGRNGLKGRNPPEEEDYCMFSMYTSICIKHLPTGFPLRFGTTTLLIFNNIKSSKKSLHFLK